MTRFARFVGWSCCGVVTSVLLTIVASPPGQTSTSELITNRASPYLSAEVAQSADDLTMPATESVDIPVLPSLETSPSAAPPVPAAPTVPAPAAPAVESPAIQPIENHEQPQAPRRDRPQLSIPSRSLPSRSQDPADQIAPPGLNVQRGSQPISPFMAIAMQKELDNLVGRFESAVFLASAVDQPVEVQVPSLDELLAASEITDISLAAEPEIHPALVEARQLIQDWTGLIDNQAYQEARDRWLSARQKIWDNFPIDRSFAQPEIRSMWLDRGTIVRAGSREGLAILFDFLQEAGINTIFLETINSSYPIYPSRVAPTQNPLTRRWDPLGAAVELAHERNMELHAWIWVFAAGNQRHNAVLNLPDSYLGPVLNAHPDWAAYDHAGSPIPRGQTKPFFDPANPEVRRYLTQLIDEIVSNYDVDGLQLDYIRYPFQDPGAERTYGYGQAARQQFRRLTGVDPIELTPQVDPWLPRAERDRQQDLWNRWTEFRIEQVNSFVEETAQFVRQKRPDIVLSAAVFPIREHERLQKIQQDWNHWAEEGWVDWIVLMSYAKDANRFEQLIHPWVLNETYDSTLIIPGIRLLNLPVPAMIDQMQALRDLPAPGYALFAVDNLDSGIQSVLKQTQSSDRDWLPQQAPQKTAAQRFQALQQEWNWLLASRQLVIEARLADSWTGQVNDLGQALNGLTDSASVAEWEAARSQVEALKRDFKAGMILQTATSPEYRLQAWENRLEAISRFLAYGVKRV